MGGRGGAPRTNLATAVAQAAARAETAVSRSPLETEILSIYRSQRQPGEWLSLADIRDTLDARGYGREAQDAALKSLVKYEPNVRMVPMANLKAATPRDWAAGIERPGSSPLMAFNIDPAYSFPKDKR
jgi:hypothetical protein